MAPIPFLFTGPADAPLLVLAHGAGAGMDSPFLERLAALLGERGVRVARFEFPYMRRARAEARRRPPDPQRVLTGTWEAVVQELGPPERLVIGGKSMGGRMASLVADRLGVRGLVCLGYPFHPPGRPEKPRTSHLAGILTPALIVQGTRDSLGGRPEVEGYRLAASIRVAFLEDGDHSFKPRKSSGRTAEQNLQEAADRVAAFVLELQRGGEA